ncbi:MAG: thioredoxin domain-containing protein [Stappiaceae bacterium]
MSNSNLLSRETSPYLIQHMDNPVHWHPWNSDALKRAQMENKPILLSIGYAACHWCHVMAHESFEDPGVAAVMNELFVSIKVDREERPDIDHIYMSALHQLGEQGGWPLTMFLTPEGKPFWGGTYFPKEAKWGRPGFVSVLREISRLFQEEPDKIRQNEHNLMTRLAMRPDNAATVTPELFDKASERLLAMMDPENGGTKGAPKFPQCSFLHLLLRAGHNSGNIAYDDAVLLTLEKICQGGIYDHLGGGFARYSVDQFWLAPHFEKMLYDNAQLLDLLLIAYKLTGNNLFRLRIEETLTWLEREMLTSEGAYSASLDADTEGEEGRYYVWQEAEIDQHLSAHSRDDFKKLYDILPQGNWEGKTILNRLHTSGTEFDETAANYEGERELLLNARQQRVRPAVDDKILADWNGLLIGALANLSAAGISRESTLEMAQRAFRFIQEKMKKGDLYGHSWRKDILLYPGQLSDQAAVIHAALGLYQATFDTDYLEVAKLTLEELLPAYRDEQGGGFFMTAAEADDLILRPKYCHDDAVPNANGLLAMELVRLYHLTGEENYRSLYEEIFNCFSADIPANVFGTATLLSAFDFSLNATSIVIVSPDKEACDDLLRIARKQSNPNLILSVLTSTDQLADNHPAKGKAAIDNRPTAFICPGQTCLAPIQSLSEFENTLRSLNR